MPSTSDIDSARRTSCAAPARARTLRASSVERRTNRIARRAAASIGAQSKQADTLGLTMSADPQLAELYEARAQTYAAFGNGAIAARALELLPPGGSVLDLGCASG